MAMLSDLMQPLRRLRQFASARLKLVTWFVAVLGGVLIAFVASLIGLVHHNLFAALNERLVTNTQQLADLVEFRQGELLFAKLDQISQENETLRTFSVQMVGPKGTVLWQAARNTLPVSSAVEKAFTTNEAQLINVVLPFERYRVLAKPVTRNGQVVGVLQSGLSLRDIDEAIAKLVIGALLSIPVALGLAGFAAWFLALKTLRPIEESVRRQRQFIQDASHELRTPLAIIQSNIDVSLQNPNPNVPQLQEKLRTVNETAQRMGKIITDLFTLSTSDSQMLRLKPRLIQLDHVAREVVKQMKSLARKKQQQLLLGELEELIVYADEDRIKQVITIFVDNAIKYTPEKGIITVAVTKTPAIDFAKISISDTGPGISRENQERIFERFFRVDKSRSRELGGNGLGLAIASTLVQRQRGHISVQSKLGKGTRFEVFLPLVAKRSSKKSRGSLTFGLPKLFTLNAKKPAEPAQNPQIAPRSGS
ncbi:MAG: ATP-binding protein [Candidatus Andersenbacteria bacterium]